jgi:hypothetical protein
MPPDKQTPLRGAFHFGWRALVVWGKRVSDGGYAAV